MDKTTKAKQFSLNDAKRIGSQLEIDWSCYNLHEFFLGLNVELEHGLVDMNTNVTDDNDLITAKIALAHLNEIPDYYTRLREMEDKAREKNNKINV